MAGPRQQTRQKPLPAINRAMRTVHIFSATPVLLTMLFFAVTGFYLNHPDLGEGAISTQQQTLKLPKWIAKEAEAATPSSATVSKLLTWLSDEHGISGIDLTMEYDELDNLLVLELSGPAGHTLVEVSFEEQTASLDQRELSLLAKLNNLHRAKHVSGLWVLLSDLSAFAMIIFSLSGCWLITVNRLQVRKATATILVGGGLFLTTALILH